MCYSFTSKCLGCGLTLDTIFVARTGGITTSSLDIICNYNGSDIHDISVNAESPCEREVDEAMIAKKPYPLPYHNNDNNTHFHMVPDS